MAINKTVYTCGCGLHTAKIEEALLHCDTTGHTMTVTGTMAPDYSRKVAKKPRVISGGASDRSASAGELDNLRKRFMQ